MTDDVDIEFDPAISGLTVVGGGGGHGSTFSYNGAAITVDTTTTATATLNGLTGQATITLQPLTVVDDNTANEGGEIVDDGGLVDVGDDSGNGEEPFENV